MIDLFPDMHVHVHACAQFAAEQLRILHHYITSKLNTQPPSYIWTPTPNRIPNTQYLLEANMD